MQIMHTRAAAAAPALQSRRTRNAGHTLWRRNMRGRKTVPTAPLAAVLVLVVGLFGTAASASYHLWQITEVYSNASGSVQFVEMFNPFGGENYVHAAGATLSSDSH